MDTAQDISAVCSAICDAMDPLLMRIECGFTRGFAGLQMLGNTSEVCRDGKERARAALERLGLHLPPQRLVISLTPADIKKDGSHFDLPIAVSLALLLAGKQPCVDPKRWLFAAELGLGGELRPVKGVVSFALAALRGGLEGIVVAAENLAELGVLADKVRAQNGGTPLKIFGFLHLSEVLGWLVGGVGGESDKDAVEGVTPLTASAREFCTRSSGPNFDDMILSPQLELAALVAASGCHSMLLRGSPGTGKSMLASRLVSIIPALAHREHIESMRIHSTCQERLPDSLLAGRPPFRAPHHQASAAAILGSADVPGEISLAHGGVLFLDELPEFRRDVLEALREPLETGEVRVSRSRRKLVWKSRIILLAACNNCPCGWDGSPRKRCRCGTARLFAYRQRLSGPVLSRIDLHVNVPEPDEESSQMLVQLAGRKLVSQTNSLRQRVVDARAFATRRNEGFGVEHNTELGPQHLVAASGLNSSEFAKLINTVCPRAASSRTVIRALRVARTLADLDGSATLRREDMLQAWSWQPEMAAKARGEEL